MDDIPAVHGRLTNLLIENFKPRKKSGLTYPLHRSSWVLFESSRWLKKKRRNEQTCEMSSFEISFTNFTLQVLGVSKVIDKVWWKSAIVETTRVQKRIYLRHLNDKPSENLNERHTPIPRLPLSTETGCDRAGFLQLNTVKKFWPLAWHCLTLEFLYCFASL